MDTKHEETLLDLHNRVTGEELEQLLKMQLKALAANPELAKTLPPLMVWGAPGLGKSSILQDVARELGIGFIDVRLAQREPVDIRGLPVPGQCIANVRDAFGCNLLWQTFYRAQTSHRMGKIYPKIERMLVDCRCDPHETTSLGVSWADVALAQYEAGISVRERDFNLQQGNGNATLDTWFHDLVGARPKGVET